MNITHTWWLVCGKAMRAIHLVVYINAHARALPRISFQVRLRLGRGPLENYAIGPINWLYIGQIPRKRERERSLMPRFRILCQKRLTNEINFHGGSAGKYMKRRKKYISSSSFTRQNNKVYIPACVTNVRIRINAFAVDIHLPLLGYLNINWYLQSSVCSSRYSLSEYTANETLALRSL